MSIDDATPAEWDRVTKKYPKIMKKYEQMVKDEVNSPEHYNYGKVECIEAIEESMTKESFKGYLKGNTIKYLWRYERKGKAVQDLEKAQWYLNKLTETIKEQGEE